MNWIKKIIIDKAIEYFANTKEAKKMFNNIREQLAGKKTYIVCISGILAAVLAWVSGSMTDVELAKAIFEALVGITIRNGISK